VGLPGEDDVAGRKGLAGEGDQLAAAFRRRETAGDEVPLPREKGGDEGIPAGLGDRFKLDPL
jgi:hypothetical protein